MKEPLKLPFIHLLCIIGSTVLLAVLDLCWSWGMFEAGVHPFSLSYLLQRFPASAFAVLVPAVVISTVLVGLRMARHPFSRLLGLVLVLGVSYLALVNGMLLFGRLSAAVRPSPTVPRQYIQPRTFLRLGSSVLAANSVNDGTLGATLRADPATAPRLSVYRGGTAVVQGGALSVRLAGASAPFQSAAPQPAWSAVFAPDRITSFFLRDIRTLTSDYRLLLEQSLPQFFLACFALLFLCAASLVLLRVTRWPLANVLLLAAAVRGYFSLYHLLAVSLAGPVARSVSDPLLARLFPQGTLMALAVILLLVDVLLIPADRWAGEGSA